MTKFFFIHLLQGTNQWHSKSVPKRCKVVICMSLYFISTLKIWWLFWWVLSFCGIWHSSPPARIQHVAFCGMPFLRLLVFDTEWRVVCEDYKAKIASMYLQSSFASICPLPGWHTFFDRLSLRRRYNYCCGGSNSIEIPRNMSFWNFFVDDTQKNSCSHTQS